MALAAMKRRNLLPFSISALMGKNSQTAEDEKIPKRG